MEVAEAAAALMTAQDRAGVAAKAEEAARLNLKKVAKLKRREPAIAAAEAYLVAGAVAKQALGAVRAAEVALAAAEKIQDLAWKAAKAGPQNLELFA